MSSSILLRVLSSAAFVLALLQAVQCQCQDYMSEDTTTCSMLFQRIQSALVGNELNLYNLRKTFAPASHPAPILVNVSYEISFGHVPHNLCPGVDNDSSLFNSSETRYLTYGWTSSAFYTFFHPAQLNRMQPQLVFLFVRSVEVSQDDSEDDDSIATAFTWDGTGPITTAQLSLYIPSLPCYPSYEDVYDTLWDITSLLKIYTEIRTNLTTWKNDDAEYVIDGTLLLTNWSDDEYADGIAILVALSQISFLLAIVFCIAILRIIFNTAPKNSEDSENWPSNEFRMWHSVLWVSVGVLAQFVFVLLLTDVIQVVAWCSSPTGCSFAVVCRAIPFFSWIIIATLLCCPCVARCIRQHLPNQDLLEVKPWSVLIFFPLNVFYPYLFVVFHPRKNPCFKRLLSISSFFLLAIFLPTLFTFLPIVSFYLLPIILLLVVHPIKVAAAYSFLTAALVLYILIASYGEYKFEASYDKYMASYKKTSFKEALFNKIPLSFNLILPQLNMIFICAIMFLYIVVYITILSGGSEISVFHALLSQIPSLILGSASWIFKKMFLKKKHTDLQMSELPQNEETTSTSSQDSQRPINVET